MKRQHPRPEVELPLSREIYNHLLTASIQTGFEKEDWELAAIAIREWAMRNNPDSFGRPKPAAINGSISSFRMEHFAGLFTKGRTFTAW
jgi:hypothetical protein